MDRAAIFSAVIKRNALRRAHGLSPLNIRSEYMRQVEIAKLRHYQDLFEGRPVDPDAVRPPVLTWLSTKQGGDTGEMTDGRCPIEES